MKKIVFSNLLFCVLSTVMLSCSDAVESREKRNADRLASSRTPEEAIAIAKSFLSELDTRGSASGTSLRLQILSSAGARATRGKVALNDTAFYLVNGDLGRGYVLLSGNRSIPPVVCYYSSGNLSEENLKEDDYLWDALNRYNRKRDDTTPKDFVFIGSDAGYVAYMENYFRWRHSYLVEPIIKTAWGQTSPYNNKTPLINGQRAMTGCSTTAIAQIMAHYEYPKKVGSYDVDWETITSKSPGDVKYDDCVSNLCSQVGSTLGVSWGVRMTGVDMLAIYPYLRMSGYDAEGNVSYDERLVQSSLSRGYPVLVMGAADYDPVRGYSNGHIWIVDGWQRWWQYVEFYNHKRPKPKSRGINYYHVNWGWNGVRNGFFAAGVFSTIGAESWDNPPSSNDGHVYEFTYQLHCIAGIHPKM